MSRITFTMTRDLRYRLSHGTLPVRGQLLDQTPKAFLIRTANRDALWLPKSKVDHNPEAGTFTVPMWLARQKTLA